MIPINYYFSAGETYLSDLPKVRVHIHHYILHILPILKTAEISDQVALLAVREYIYYLLVVRIRKDSLILFAIGIALEFINGQHLRQLLTGVIYELEIPQRSLSRNIVFVPYLFGRAKVFEFDEYICYEPVRCSVVAWEKVITLKEALITVPASISALSHKQVCMDSMGIQILDLLYPVVMYLVCFIAAAGANMCTAWQFYFYVAAALIFINIFCDHIFQSKQFCGIIFHRAYSFISSGGGNFILKDFFVMLYFYFPFFIKNVGYSRPETTPAPTFSLEPFLFSDI